MKTFGICFIVIFLTAPALAQNEQQNVAEIAVKTAMLHCIAPILTGDDIGRLAQQQELPEFPAEQANKFLRGAKGRVFAIPQAPGKVILKALDNGICQVAVRELNTENFWLDIARSFTLKDSPWTLVEEINKNGGIKKSYTANQNGNIAAHISARDKPVVGGVQALITISRYK